MKTAVVQKKIENPLLRFLAVTYSTAFGLGLAPFAPGTFGSLLGIPLGLWLLKFPGWQALIFAAVFMLISMPIVERTCHHWGEMDASRVVIDEVLGQALAMLSLRYFILNDATPSTEYIVAAFFLFRVLDIFKPFPAKTFDRRGDGLGIMGDDVVAGLYTSLILYGFIKVAPHL